MERELTVEEICAKLKPVFGKKIDEIYLKYAMAGTREERDEIAHLLNALYHKNLSELLNKKVLLEPPSKEEVSGEYPLGIVNYADRQLYDFGLREKDWVRHMCVSGMSGSGKTTFAFHIINNFIKHKKPFLVFDWKKSFRPLLVDDSEIMNFTIGNDKISNLFKMNINEPPEGVAPKEWINVLCDLITESFFVSFGVHKVLLETLDEAYKEWGIYNGSKNYPTWYHIKWRLEQKIEKAGGRESTWLESALRIASVLTFGSFGNVVNYKGDNQVKVGDLLNKKVIFELNALSNIEKKFFCEFILTYIYKLKKAGQSNISNTFEHAIIVDEAHNIFLKDKTNFVSESITDMIYREMREYGIGLICLDQHVSKLSDTVAGNSAVHVAFQQQLPQDIMVISGLTQLYEKKQFFSMLPVGSAIVKMNDRYTSPFLINVKDVKQREIEVTDEDVKSRMDFIYQVKDVEGGKDEEFSKDLINVASRDVGRISDISDDPRVIKLEEEKVKGARVPNHDLYNGKIGKFSENDFGKVPKMELGTKDEGEQEENKLNGVQEILYDYVKVKLKEGISLNDIRGDMENKRFQGGYSLDDIFTVINYALNNLTVENSALKDDVSDVDNKVQNEVSVVVSDKSGNGVVTSKLRQKQKIYKGKNDKIVTQSSNKISNKMTDEQEKFVVFLQDNPTHNFSTVNLYKEIGFSPRKGNKIKDQLMERDLIEVDEIKNEKGWKKIIKLKNL